uniref:RNase_PH domain-containing protein n=1 Tax=Glossina pallidipes TaxID=7398 RepID=A0A1B0A6A4_GLOPL
MTSFNSNESFITYGTYKPKENIDELFERLQKPKELKLEPRLTFLKVGTVSNVKGSAYMEYGNTKVMAQIEPPKELNKQPKKSDPLGVIVCSVKYAPFAVDDVEIMNRKESFMSAALKKALGPVVCLNEFPNFQLEIKALVLDDDGCALSTAITCCGVALIDAGIPTYDLITASTVCLLKGVEFFNPSSDIEDLLHSLPCITEANGLEEHGIIVVASLSTGGQVSEFFQKGYIKSDTLERLCEHLLVINQRLLDTVRHVLIDKVKYHIAQEREQLAGDTNDVENA